MYDLSVILEEKENFEVIGHISELWLFMTKQLLCKESDLNHLTAFADF